MAKRVSKRTAVETAPVAGIATVAPETPVAKNPPVVEQNGANAPMEEKMETPQTPQEVVLDVETARARIEARRAQRLAEAEQAKAAKVAEVAAVKAAAAKAKADALREEIGKIEIPDLRPWRAAEGTAEASLAGAKKSLDALRFEAKTEPELQKEFEFVIKAEQAKIATLEAGLDKAQADLSYWENLRDVRLGRAKELVRQLNTLGEKVTYGVVDGRVMLLRTAEKPTPTAPPVNHVDRASGIFGQIFFELKKIQDPILRDRVWLGDPVAIQQRDKFLRRAEGGIPYTRRENDTREQLLGILRNMRVKGQPKQAKAQSGLRVQIQNIPIEGLGQEKPLPQYEGKSRNTPLEIIISSQTTNANGTVTQEQAMVRGIVGGGGKTTNQIIDGVTAPKAKAPAKGKSKGKSQSPKKEEDGNPRGRRPRK